MSKKSHQGCNRITDPGVWGQVKIRKLQLKKSFKLLARVDRNQHKSFKTFLKKLEIVEKIGCERIEIIEILPNQKMISIENQLHL